MKNEDDHMFFPAVNERGFQFVEVRRLVNEIVEFVLGSRVLDVMYNHFQYIHAESTWSQFLIKGRIDDSLEDGNDSPEFVGVGGDLGDRSVNAEVKASLNFELLGFVPNVLNHLVQLVEVLLMKPDDINKKICLLFLSCNGSLQLRNLNSVVGGQHECSGRSDKRGDVPLASLTFRNMREAGQKILEEFEHLTDIRFIEFESAV
jgi:hypothetical protein